VDLRLTEAEPPEALRMLRAGYVDVALIFRHEAEGPSSTSVTGLGNAAGSDGTAGPDSTAGSDSTGTKEARAGHGGDKAAAAGSPDGEGLREQVLLEEPVNLVMPDGAASLSLPRIAPAVTELWPDDLARFADHRWIAGCDRCREHLLQQCAAAGYTPKIAFTTDDFVAVQALVTAGLGVALLPSLALSAARNPAVRVLRLRGTRRSVVAVRYGEPPDPPATGLLMGALRAAATSPADALPGTAVPAAASGWPQARPVPPPAPAVLG
jgi:DNA-binding transcriptional LysR family regulator